MTEPTTPQTWARREAEVLREFAAQNGPWADNRMVQSVRPQLAMTLEFFRQHAPGSEFAKQAAEAVGSRDYAQNVAARLAILLDGWAAWVETGLGPAETFAVRARVEAATDLMEQVQRLLDDTRVHPAAPVMLAGAALEELLRAEVEVAGATVKGRPGLSAYADALRTVGALTAQDVKDITSWAGQRNEAAHGEFDRLTRERATLLAEAINLFMRQRRPGKAPA